MTLNEAIQDIQQTNALSAATRNSLHGATDGHPWCKGKSLERRKQEAVFAVAGKVNGQQMINIERATA